MNTMPRLQKLKLIAIVGPTASGKSELGVAIARSFNGEIISADSRQVYRGLNIGTGKITKQEMRGVHHHLINVADPRKRYSVVEFVASAERIVRDISGRDKIPIIVGGTGFWIDALVSGAPFPGVAPNAKLRTQLSKKSAGELFRMLKKLDPRRARTIEAKNPHRLIRAIEIARAIGRVPPLKKANPRYDILWLGVTRTPTELNERIRARLTRHLKAGMIAEARKLRLGGLAWKRFDELGLEYRLLARHIKGELSRSKLIQNLERAILDYARRQMVWFRKNPAIHWIGSSKAARQLVKNFSRAPVSAEKN